MMVTISMNSTTDVISDSSKLLAEAGKRYIRIFFTIDYEGVIVLSIGFLRREVAR